MEDAELVQKAEESIKDGFSPEEVAKALRDDGYNDKKINRVMATVKQDLKKNYGNRNQRDRQNYEKSNQSIGSKYKDTVTGADLTDSSYVLKQKFVRNKYRLYDRNEDLVLKAKQKLFRFKEDIPFKDSEDRPVFSVKAENYFDVAGDYTIIDESSGDPIAVLEKRWSLLHHKWRVKSGDNSERLLAKISSRGGIDILRFLGEMIPYLPNPFIFVPHKYAIEDPDGNEIGSISGHLSIRDVYDIELQENKRAPHETLVAASVAIDALQGN